MTLDDIPTPVFEVAIVLVAGASFVAGVFTVGALIGLGVYGARCVGHHRQNRARETTRGMA